MSDKRTGKKIKRAAAAAAPPTEVTPATVSELTARPAMKKKGK